MTDLETAIMIKNTVRETVKRMTVKNVDYGGKEGKKKIRELVKQYGRNKTLEILKENQKNLPAGVKKMFGGFGSVDLVKAAEMWLDEALSEKD